VFQDGDKIRPYQPVILSNTQWHHYADLVMVMI